MHHAAALPGPSRMHCAAAHSLARSADCIEAGASTAISMEAGASNRLDHPDRLHSVGPQAESGGPRKIRVVPPWRQRRELRIILNRWAPLQFRLMDIHLADLLKGMRGRLPTVEAESLWILVREIVRQGL
jgi:hypothetical protein